MIGIDTNVLVRYLTQDEPIQAAEATYFLETVCQPNQLGFVSLVTLVELSWVLGKSYKYDKSTLLNVLYHLFSTETLHIENEGLAWEAYWDYKNGSADFADYVLGRVNQQHGCIYTATFDQKAAKNPHFRLLST